MNIRVVYHSMTGNTRKVAEAIAAEAKCAAEKSTEADPRTGADILFIGAALHKSEFDPSVARFIAGLNGAKVKRVAVFATYFNEIAGENALRRLSALLRGNGIETEGPGFACRGKFLFFNRGKPDAKALDGAKAFARSIIDKA